MKEEAERYAKEWLAKGGKKAVAQDFGWLKLSSVSFTSSPTSINFWRKNLSEIYHYPFMSSAEKRRADFGARLNIRRAIELVGYQEAKRILEELEAKELAMKLKREGDIQTEVDVVRENLEKVWELLDKFPSEVGIIYVSIYPYSVHIQLRRKEDVYKLAKILKLEIEEKNRSSKKYPKEWGFQYRNMSIFALE